MNRTARGQYQLFDDLPSDDYERLKADIGKRGLLVPVELDEHGNMLDGHHRARACAELGITDYPRLVRPGMTETEKRAHVRALNLLRRHLTSEQKRTVIADQLRETPEQSDRQIASELGVTHPTVGSVRKELESKGDVEKTSTRTDSKGRKQPAKKPRSLKPTPAGILATTPAEEAKAVRIAPAVEPNGVVPVAEAAREVRREEREVARQETEAAKQEASVAHDRLIAALPGDYPARYHTARLRSAYTEVRAAISGTLLPLNVESLAETFDDGDWQQAARTHAALNEWFERLFALRARGLHLVGRST